jgi:Fe-S-cluster-containing hydrogenase component 2
VDTPGRVSPYISITWERCVNSRHRNLNCERCQQSCPTEAILSTRPVRVDQTRCALCGMCAAICPMEAISTSGPGDLELAARMAALLEADGNLELACHKAVRSGEFGRNCRQVFQLPCLATLSSTVLSSAMLRAEGSIWLNDSMCSGCEWGKVLGSVRVVVNEARTIAQALGRHNNLLSYGEDSRGTDRARRKFLGKGSVKVTRSGEREMSRRDLLTLFRQKATEPGPGDGSHPILQRRQLLSRLIGTGFKAVEETVLLSGLSVGQPVLVADCSGCGVCARVCPSSALQFQLRGREGILSVEISRCMGCGACVMVCSTRSMAVSQSVPMTALRAGSVAVLWKAELTPCSRCGSLFHATDSTRKTCTLCDMLRRGPASWNRTPA